MNSFNNYKAIKEEVYKLQRNCNLIVVTKNQSIETIMPIINSGHLHFGENKVQEAKEKWNSFLADKKKDVKLHMIGKLQSNKAKDAFSLFDFIHTLDSDKLAKIFAGLESDSQRNIKYFIQINIGNEMQKNGINSSLVKEFTNYCRNDLKLNIIGLMCIPPVGIHPSSFFQKMQELKVTNNLNELSMGMSSDYKEALHHGSTYLRIGSAIFK
jgi:pyridoxal phosphate enzyme (YggS family)